MLSGLVSRTASLDPEMIRCSLNITAAGAVDREFNSGFCRISSCCGGFGGLGGVPAARPQKFRFRWPSGEPEMIFKSPDQAPGQLRIFL